MKYLVTLKIADHGCQYETGASMRVLWKLSISLMRWAKWHNCKARFIVRDMSGNVLFWVYCRNDSGNGYRVRLNNTGKYGRWHFEI